MDRDERYDKKKLYSNNGRAVDLQQTKKKINKMHSMIQ